MTSVRKSAFSLNVDVGDLAGLSARLGAIDAGVLGAMAMLAVNEVTTRFDEAQRKAQNYDIALSDEYISSKTTTILAASTDNPRATITTSGALTVMSHYPTEVVQNKASGNRRTLGVKAIIKPSAPVFEKAWFEMKLLNGNGVGVFARTSEGKKKHMYGPSPYSLFRHQIEVGEDRLIDDLSKTSVSAIADAVQKALTL